MSAKTQTLNHSDLRAVLSRADTASSSAQGQKIHIPEEEYRWRKEAADAIISEILSKINMPETSMPKVTSKMTGIKFLSKIAKTTSYGELYLLLVKLHATLEFMGRFEEPAKIENIEYEEPDYY
jgi:hypothetical protein